MGRELRRARLRLGLSYRQASQRAGVAHGHLCDLEHGRRAPSVAVAESIIFGYRLKPDVACRLLAEAIPDAGRSWLPPAESSRPS